jgi:ubiquinone biosynthesis protein COQ9
MFDEKLGSFVNAFMVFMPQNGWTREMVIEALERLAARMRAEP